MIPRHSILVGASASAWSLSLGYKDLPTGPSAGADATSHNIAWAIDIPGDGASSVLNDSANNMRIAVRGEQNVQQYGAAQTATICLPVSFSVRKFWETNIRFLHAVGDGD